VQNLKVILYISLFLVSVAGVLPSVFYNDWAWFSRSGALLVIIGAYFTWSDFITEIEDHFNEERNSINENINSKFALLKNNSFGVIENPEYASELINRESIEKLGNISLSQKSKIRTYRYVEILTMAIGTLIWAYGDLFNECICR